MTVHQVLTALGDWEVDLKNTTPRDVLDAIAFFGHVAIVPGRVDPRTYGDNLLTAARYVGVVRTKTLADDGRTKAPGDKVNVGGVGMAMWLGDEDNKGAVYENNITISASGFPQTIRALLPSSGAVTEGTLYSVAGTYTGTHRYQSPREAIQYVCQTMSTASVPVSWRVNGNGTLDAGPESNLYVTSPQCAIVARGDGQDLALRALPGQMNYQSDVEDYTTRVVLLAEGDGNSVATGSADITPGLNPYKDIHGNTLKLTRLVSESDTATANASVRAQLALSQFQDSKDALTLTASDYDVEGSFDVGDYVWVYDPDKNLVDTTQEIAFRGQRLNPIRLQVTEATWPVTTGYTVAYRAADGTWTDLTSYVDWEQPGSTQIVVGGFTRQLVDTGSEPVGSRPFQDTSTPAAPAWVTPFQNQSYADGRGFSRSRVLLSWNAPLNTDGSTVQDGDHYDIRYRLNTTTITSATWAQVGTLRWEDLGTWASPIPPTGTGWQFMTVAWGQSTAYLQDLSTGVGYDVQIRAVDTSNNAGAWSPTNTFYTNPDDIPPSTPAPPAVAGSRIALQVTHQLGKATGGTFNLESDLHHLEIHVEYEPGFTPSASTLKGKVSATAGMIQAQIPAITTVQVDETSTRYVKVIAVDIAGNQSAPSDAVSATALLIDDAHISDLTVTKVTAGTISADWIVGARIKTADSGPRVELNSGGIGAWNAGGDQTVYVSSATGDVRVLGQIVSAFANRRVEINPTSTYLPEIRFYASTGSAYSYINGVSSDATVSLGINGSSFVDGGTAVHSRVYLASGTSQFAVVRDDTQDREGGYVLITHNNAYFGYISGGTDGGHLSATSSALTLWGGQSTGGQANVDSAGFTIWGNRTTGGYFTAGATSAQVGAVLNDAEDAYLNFDHADGTIRAIGEIDYYNSAQNALLMGHLVMGGSFVGANITYGATSTGAPQVLATLYDPSKASSNALATNVTTKSTTGFSFSFNGSCGSSAEIAWWAFRTN